MLSVAAQRALRRLRRGKAAAAELDRLPPAERAVVGRQFLQEVEARLQAADRALAGAEADLARLRAQRAALGLLADLAIGAFQRLLDGAVGKLGDLLAWVSGLPGRVLGALGDLAGSLWSAGLDAGKALINGLVEGIKAISIPVPRIDVGMGETFGVPHPTVDIGVDWRSIGSIIGAEFGALIDQPTLALVGENPATAPEIISPVATMRRVVREELARSGRPGQAVTVNQTIQGVQPGDVERETLRALRRAALQWSLS